MLAAAMSAAALGPVASRGQEPAAGATPRTEKSIERGTRWLLKTMHRNGGCGVDIGQPPDIGCTAMVGLSLLTQGNTPLEGPYQDRSRQVMEFLLDTVQRMPEGANDITQVTNTQLQSKIGRHAHSFFAALFLSQVAGETRQVRRVRTNLSRLVEAIERAQQADGSWGSGSWAPTLGTVMGWVSLRAAQFAGYKVEASAAKTAKLLAGQMLQRIGSQRAGWMHTLYKNATGIRVLYAMGRDEEDAAKKALADVLKLVTKDNTPFTQAGGEEFLAFHLITETMLQKGGDAWRQWYPVVRDKLIAVQNGDGSWTGHHCITSRTFCTAAAILVLSSPNRYLPISQQ